MRGLYLQILRIVGDLEFLPWVAIAAEMSILDGSKVGNAYKCGYNYRL